MVFVVNTSLKMKPGKLASQVAHTGVSLYIKAKTSPKNYFFGIKEIDTWVLKGQKKIVLKGIDDTHLNDLIKKAGESKLLSILIRDAGHTHLIPGSLTCLGIFGKEEEVNAITGSLRLYN